jgi:hypothetical protein
MTVEIDGHDARWRVAYRYHLADDEANATFASLRGDIENDTETYTDTFEERVDAELDNSSVESAQGMSVYNVTVQTARTDDYETVTYRFLWEDFAHRNNSGLVVDDGLTVLSLGANTSLTLTYDDGYRPKDLRPTQPVRATGRSRTTPTPRWRGSP